MSAMLKMCNETESDASVHYVLSLSWIVCSHFTLCLFHCEFVLSFHRYAFDVFFFIFFPLFFIFHCLSMHCTVQLHQHIFTPTHRPNINIFWRNSVSQTERKLFEPEDLRVFYCLRVVEGSLKGKRECVEEENCRKSSNRQLWSASQKGRAHVCKHWKKKYKNSGVLFENSRRAESKILQRKNRFLFFSTFCLYAFVHILRLMERMRRMNMYWNWLQSSGNTTLSVDVIFLRICITFYAFFFAR